MEKKDQYLYFKNPKELIAGFRSRDLPDNFCIIPFINIILNPNGDIGICRQKGTQHKVGNIKKESLEEVWNNSYMQQWREEFLTGNVSICKHEIEKDACHLGVDNYLNLDQVELAKVQKKPILKFTCNFNGQCNLRCKMCDIWMMENGLYDELNFWEKAEKEFFPNIKELEFLSGEPFIQKDTYRLIELMEKLNPECLWSFTTNAHWNFTKKIQDYLDKIDIRNIIVSIDSLNPETYSKIRLDGDLNKVVRTVEDLYQYNRERIKSGKRDLGLSLHFLVMKENYKEIPEFIKFVNTYKMRLTVNLLEVPSEYSLFNLSDDEKKEVIEYLLSMDTESISRSIQASIPLIKSLNPMDKVVYLEKLNRIVSIDKEILGGDGQ